ncbi:hypothetical protein [Alkalihalobacillus sp. LMS39]|uniref:hypothetical protein n=1 Tax=Alkalihalobacillus sp. LMS39 TaxID=2924032 RepID=UPI001FB536BF|nr:hypothetical protein [Alkalihalobacillus sp. LMS39]UOE95023.1 hypothetical protein MM271_05070 [Alkalihalobacillus sp. LMS39]
MKKFYLFMFLILLVITGCSQQNKALENSIYSIVEDQNNEEIQVQSLTDFEWDKAFLFEPYTSNDVIIKTLGVDFKDPSNIEMREDIYLLVFLHENNVVHYVEINRQQNSFSLGEKEYITPNEDLIFIDRH